MNIQNNFRAVLFDLDGTLLNTLEDLTDSVNAVLRSHGYPEHSPEAYRFFVGDGIHNLILRALPQNISTDELARTLLPEVDAQYDALWHTKTSPYPGTHSIIQELKHRNVKLAVLSNKPHRFTVKIVEHFFPDAPFDIVYGFRDGIPRKPDPSAALDIADKFSIPPQEFIYVGDSNTDIKTALSAGMFAAGVSWGFRPVEELVEAGANMIITNPDDILRLL